MGLAREAAGSAIFAVIMSLQALPGRAADHVADARGHVGSRGGGGAGCGRVARGERAQPLRREHRDCVRAAERGAGLALPSTTCRAGWSPGWRTSPGTARRRRSSSHG